MEFDIRQTRIAKGIAILLMIWHHLFYNTSEYYQRFVSLYSINGVPVECKISDYSKVCVAMFVVLSGYGLFKSWVNRFGLIRGGNYNPTNKDQIGFVKNRLIKLLFGFWIIYLLFVPMSIWFGKPFWKVYKGNVFFGLVDFIGISTFFSTPTMNPTWWFMGVIIVFYLLFPFLLKFFSYSKELLLVVAALLMILPIKQYTGALKTWMFPFVLGMYFADIDGFKRIEIALNSWVKRIFIIAFSLVFTAEIQRGNKAFSSFFAIAVICFSFIIVSRIPVICNVLEILGKHSANIFMFHTFIFEIYFQSFIYGFKYSIVIYLILVLLCLAVSIFIEQLKRVIGINKLLTKITG